MNESVTGAPAESSDSPTKVDAPPAAPSPAPESAAGQSPEGGQKSFDQKVSELESGFSAKPEAPPATEQKPESAPQPEATAKTDEPAAEPGKGKDDKALSQQDEVLNKAFDERPEWKKAISLVPKEKAGEMRETMRAILKRENEIASQVEERFKPQVQKLDRFRKAVGDDQAMENTIALTELFQRGDPKARGLLVDLLNDLDSRTGAVLTSKDLVDRMAASEKQFEDGLITKEVLDQRKGDLLEIQKARVGQRQTETQSQQQQIEEQRRQFQSQQKEMDDACESWEGEKMKSDPDYPSLKTMVEQRAFFVGNERQMKLKGRLLNGTEMKAVLDESLTWAKAEAARLRPAPKPHDPITATSSSATSRRAPANPKERFDQRVDELESRL